MVKRLNESIRYFADRELFTNKKYCCLLKWINNEMPSGTHIVEEKKYLNAVGVMLIKLRAIPPKFALYNQLGRSCLISRYLM